MFTFLCLQMSLEIKFPDGQFILINYLSQVKIGQLTTGKLRTNESSI